jgi:hypothetical protein
VQTGENNSGAVDYHPGSHSLYILVVALAETSYANHRGTHHFVGLGGPGALRRQVIERFLDRRIESLPVHYLLSGRVGAGEKKNEEREKDPR